MPLLPQVHRPIGWRDKPARDRDYAVHRDRASLALLSGRAWRKARLGFLNAAPLCVDCGRAATVVDHRDPHRGDPAVFWDRGRWQSMCASCHGRKTALRDRGFGHPARPRRRRGGPRGKGV
jgi:5-methylcytosine-specific restriction protein A